MCTCHSYIKQNVYHRVIFLRQFNYLIFCTEIDITNYDKISTKFQTYRFIVVYCFLRKLCYIKCSISELYKIVPVFTKNQIFYAEVVFVKNFAQQEDSLFYSNIALKSHYTINDSCQLQTGSFLN